MTYTLVQAGTVASGTTSPLAVTAASTTAGNLLVAGFGTGGTVQPTSITFPAGWTRAVQRQAGSVADSDIWYYPNCPAGITSVSITWSGATAAAAAQILEFHDSAGTNTSPLDVTGFAVANVPSPEPISTGSATAASGELAVAVANGNYATATKDSLAAGAGFTQGGQYGTALKQAQHISFDYQLSTAAAGVITDSVTFTGPFAGFAGAIATFKVFDPAAPTMTVTASEATNAGAGVGLQVMVITGQAASPAGATASAAIPASAAIQVSLTTTVTGSLVFAAAGNNNGSVAPVAASGNTITGSFNDPGGAYYWACRTTSATGTPGATTIGSTAAARGAIAAVEVLKGTTLAIDGSGPAYASSSAASSVTSASFTPPPGALLIALFAGQGQGNANQQTTAVSDSSGLTWTKQAERSGTTVNGVAAVWTAVVPGGAAPSVSPGLFGVRGPLAGSLAPGSPATYT